MSKFAKFYTKRKQFIYMEREMNKKHDEVAEYYRKNVTLVKNYERMTDALQTLVVNNTRAVEHLSTIVETRSKM